MAGAVLVAALAGATWAVVDSRKLTVPDLVGLPVADVASQFDTLDLDLQPVGELPSAGLLDFTTVTGQSPHAGETVALLGAFASVLDDDEVGRGRHCRADRLDRVGGLHRGRWTDTAS